MPQQYSISEARRRLGRIVQEAESSGPILLTRRGRTVAVLLSQAEYERLLASRFDFGEAYRQFRASADFAALGIEPAVFAARDSSPGREVSF